MKKRFAYIALLLIFLLLAVACEEISTPPIVDEPTETEATSLEIELPDAYELCPYCGEHYVHEPLRQPTSPLNIHEVLVPWQGPDADFPQEEHEANVAEFVYGFENVHTVTYVQFETNWYATIILWADTTLRNFSFVSLDVAGHDWDEDYQLIINTREVLLTIGELLPTDAVVLNVAFAHYILPHGAIILGLD